MHTEVTTGEWVRGSAGKALEKSCVKEDQCKIIRVWTQSKDKQTPRLTGLRIIKDMVSKKKEIER